MNDYAYIEFGLMVDRTSDGRGYWLDRTDRDLSRIQKQIVSGRVGRYPAEIQRRWVRLGDWRSLPEHVPEHVPECNDQCQGDDHMLAPIQGDE